MSLHLALCLQRFRIMSAKIFIDVFLTLKVPITTAADDIHKYFFIVFQKKLDLMFQFNSFARQMIHMKNQALFSLKDKSKKIKCCLLQFLFGALTVFQTRSNWDK